MVQPERVAVLSNLPGCAITLGGDKRINLHALTPCYADQPSIILCSSPMTAEENMRLSSKQNMHFPQVPKTVRREALSRWLNSSDALSSPTPQRRSNSGLRGRKYMHHQQLNFPSLLEHQLLSRVTSRVWQSSVWRQ